MKFSYLTIILALLVPFSLECQPLEPPSPTPIDGGLSLLMASGAALGLARYRQMKKREI